MGHRIQPLKKTRAWDREDTHLMGLGSFTGPSSKVPHGCEDIYLDNKAKHEQVLLKMIVNGFFSRKGITFLSGPMFIGLNYSRKWM
jgi:hypothetical protein